MSGQLLKKTILREEQTMCAGEWVVVMAIKKLWAYFRNVVCALDEIEIKLLKQRRNRRSNVESLVTLTLKGRTILVKMYITISTQTFNCHLYIF